MLVIQDIAELRRWRAAAGRVVLVPTMGNLHEGHLTLVDLAKGQGDTVVSSIFVNPTQFGPGEDFETYPRTWEDDTRRLRERGCSAVFAPSVDEMYPQGAAVATRVSVAGVTDVLCGASRPGHFDGVATVVSMLFHLTEPDVAVFGEKDFQQLLIIRRMVEDQHFPVAIVGAPIVREPDGLAMSSRNRYLTASERERAPQLHQELRRIAMALRSGDAAPARIAELGGEAVQRLSENGWQPDYVEVRDETDLSQPAPGCRTLRVFGAARLGAARLIDNWPVIWE